MNLSEGRRRSEKEQRKGNWSGAKLEHYPLYYNAINFTANKKILCSFKMRLFNEIGYNGPGFSYMPREPAVLRVVFIIKGFFRSLEKV